MDVILPRGLWVARTTMAGVELPDLEDFRMMSVPEYVKQRNQSLLDEARRLYPLQEEVAGARPAIAHRDPKAVEALPAGVVQRMDHIVSSNFSDLKMGVDYDRRHSGLPANVEEAGFFRTVSFQLPESATVMDRQIYAVRLKGVAFHPDRLDKEFDLFDLYRATLKYQIPRNAVRMDYYINRDGVVVPSPHVNEPLGGEDIHETAGEAVGDKKMFTVGQDVDVPLTWYDYPGFETPKGVKLGVMGVGLTSRTRESIGTHMAALLKKYEEPIKRGDETAIADWKRQTNETFLGYIQHMKRLHGGGKGFSHGSPHPGQFHIADGGPRIITSDLHMVEDMKDMPYPQRIGLMAMDFASVIEYSARYNGDAVFQPWGFDFFQNAFAYFDKVGDRGILDHMKSLSIPGESGQPPIKGVFGTSAKTGRPLIEYKGNPLIKAFMAQYPE
jgi:hypothetical protein